jgi:CRP-like cAMP-binding protein
MGDTIIVEQDDPCKFIYFVKSGSFQVLREIKFVESLSLPIESYI